MQARRGEGHAPGQARAVERRQGALAEHARRLQHRQRDRIARHPDQLARGRLPRDPLSQGSAKPDVRQFRQHGGVIAILTVQRHHEIEFLAIQPFEQAPVAIHRDLDPHAGMGALEPAEQVRQPAIGEIAGQAEAHHALDRDPARRRHRLVVQGHQPSRIGQHRLARLGRDEPAAVLAEQRHADLVLQLADLLADRRLRPPDDLRRPAEAAEALCADQGAQHVEIEVGGHGSVF